MGTEFGWELDGLIFFLLKQLGFTPSECLQKYMLKQYRKDIFYLVRNQKMLIFLLERYMLKLYQKDICYLVQRLGKPQINHQILRLHLERLVKPLATPVLSNTGTDRGLPISCFGIDVGDSIYEIGKKELRTNVTFAKHGGGVGIG